MTTLFPIHPIIEEIDAFCGAQGIKPSTFGTRALGDPSLVRTLRDGRDPGSKTVAAIRHFMLTGQRIEGKHRRRKAEK